MQRTNHKWEVGCNCEVLRSTWLFLVVNDVYYLDMTTSWYTNSNVDDKVQNEGRVEATCLDLKQYTYGPCLFKLSKKL